MLPSLHALTLKDAPRKRGARKGKSISMLGDDEYMTDDEPIPGTPPPAPPPPVVPLQQVEARLYVNDAVVVHYANSRSHSTAFFVSAADISDDRHVLHELFTAFRLDVAPQQGAPARQELFMALSNDDVPLSKQRVVDAVANFLYYGPRGQVENYNGNSHMEKLFLGFTNDQLMNPLVPQDPALLYRQFVYTDTILKNNTDYNIQLLLSIVTDYDVPDNRVLVPETPPPEPDYVIEDVEASITAPPAQGSEKVVAPAKPEPEAV